MRKLLVPRAPSEEASAHVFGSDVAKERDKEDAGGGEEGGWILHVLTLLSNVPKNCDRRSMCHGDVATSCTRRIRDHALYDRTHHN